MAEYDSYTDSETEAYRRGVYAERARQRKTLHWIGKKPKHRRKPRRTKLRKRRYRR